MGKKSHKKKSTSKKPIQEQNIDKFSYVFRNIIISFFLLIFLFFLKEAVPGYKWLYNSLVMANLKIIINNPNLDINKKYEAKLGFDYRYINYVKHNTPKDAVVLMPSQTTFAESDLNQRGSWGVKSRIWSTYFLYPRILVSEDQKDTDPHYKRITHVMIVNGWGYEKLNYPVEEKYKYNILPINVPGDTE